MLGVTATTERMSPVQRYATGTGLPSRRDTRELKLRRDWRHDE